MLSFERSEDRDWVVMNQPSHFDGNLFASQELLGMEQPSTIEISLTCLWVQVSDMPIDVHIDYIIRSLARKVGTLISYEEPSLLDPSEFVKIRVNIDVRSPSYSITHPQQPWGQNPKTSTSRFRKP